MTKSPPKFYDTSSLGTTITMYPNKPILPKTGDAYYSIEGLNIYNGLLWLLVGAVTKDINCLYSIQNASFLPCGINSKTSIKHRKQLNSTEFKEVSYI